MTTQLSVCLVDASNNLLLLQSAFSLRLSAQKVRAFSSGQTLLEALPRLYYLPRLILLDLRLSDLSGYQTLLELKQAPAFTKIPVVLFCADATDEEISACYQAGANSFVKIPLEPLAMDEIIDSICQYWLEVCQNPFQASFR